MPYYNLLCVSVAFPTLVFFLGQNEPASSSAHLEFIANEIPQTPEMRDCTRSGHLPPPPPKSACRGTASDPLPKQSPTGSSGESSEDAEGGYRLMEYAFEFSLSFFNKGQPFWSPLSHSGQLSNSAKIPAWED